MRSRQLLAPVFDQLGVLLRSRRGQPLGPECRRVMERCFGQDFRAVRIDAGPTAASITKALGARALTWGDQILFGAGEFCPTSPQGRFLLAHELAHVVQQRGVPPPRVPVEVGPEHDAVEAEANRAAALAVAGCPVPPLMPDHSRLARRAVSVDAGSVTIEMHTEGVRPGFFLEQNLDGFMFCHLTQNFIPAFALNSGPAWKAIARFKVNLAKGDTLAGWEFGFIQFLKQITLEITYVDPYVPAGLISGKLGQDWTMGQKFILDTLPAISPWTTAGGSRMRFTFTPPDLITCIASDHPMLKPMLVVKNSQTKRNSHFFQVWDQREFATVLMSQDPAKKFTPLAHFSWSLQYAASLHWQHNLSLDQIRPSVANSALSSFKMGPVTLGEPTDPEVKPLLKDLRGTDYNTTLQTVFEKFKAGAPSVRQDSDRNPLGTGEGFYTVEV
jgi:hypothetical protein